MALMFNERTGMFDEVSSTNQTRRQKANPPQDLISQLSTKLEDSWFGKYVNRLYISVVVVLLGVAVFQYYDKHRIERQNRILNSKVLELEASNKILISRINRLENQYSELKSSNNSMSTTLNTIKKQSPIVIRSVSVYYKGPSSDTRIEDSSFLNPKVEIFSLIDGRVDIYVKLYTPSGFYCNVSGEMYSFYNTFKLSKNKLTTCTFSHWDKSGSWEPGNYRYEFYYKNKCIGIERFTID